MSLNIKSDAAHRHEHGGSLANRLLAIGRDCAAHLKEPYRTIDRGDLLYDERGLPRWSSMPRR